MWRHPKYYKELRKLRNKLDQAISDAEATAASERATGPGLKQRDSTGGVPGEADISVTSFKPQASGTKRQATSKPEPVQVQQASSAKRQASQPE
jgi:hypothetical protein